jgi:RNA polymerase sigma-70 factor (ECF subfamily)
MAEPDVSRQRKVVDAFLAAVRGGDFEALVAVLDPDVTVREDRIPGALRELRGARVVAEQALLFGRHAAVAMPVLVNGAAGVVSRLADGQLFSVMRFTVKDASIVAIDVLRDPGRLSRIDVSALDG